MTDNRRQVWIRGSVGLRDLHNLTDFVSSPTIHPLGCVAPRVTGLNLWPAPRMDVVGDLAMPEVDIQALADCVAELPTVAPSLLLTIDVGSSYRDPTCEATILADAHMISIRDPQVPRLRRITDDEQLERIQAVLLARLEGH